MKAGTHSVFTWGVLLAALLALTVLMWDRVKEFLSDLFTTSPTESHEQVDTVTIKPTAENPTPQPVAYNMWNVNANAALVGKTLTLLKSDALKKIVNDLNSAGVVILDDNVLMQAMRQCHFKTQVNQVVTAFRNSYIYIAQPWQDLYSYLEFGLSEEHFDELIAYLNKLPNGWN